jgi:glucosamine 6-phosphate synthetase-like amidotransferase/phosphosugar isomerase protein
MIYSQHVTLIPSKLEETLSLANEYKKMNIPANGRVFIVGSGSSYSHSIFLRDLLETRITNQIRVLNPYTFVTKHTIEPEDVLIHITQEAKRNDNRCPMEYAKKQGAKIILFTTKQTEIARLADEMYWYAPEHEKLLVACESYISAYIPLLQWANVQSRNPEQIDWNKVIQRVKECVDTDFDYINQFQTFLYAGISQTVAVEAALKINECLLIPAEYYELKHFSHGKHFVTYNKAWTFNVLVENDDKDLIDLYKSSIFEPHHQVNYFESKLSGDEKVLEWAALMLKYVADGMNKTLIELENIPIRDKIRLPHDFSY